MNELILLAINQEGAAPAGGGIMGLLPLLLMFVIFYFLLIRPQRKRMKQHEEMIQRLKKGDRVVTNGGLIGTIHALTDTEIVLEIGDRAKVRVVRSQVNLYGQQGVTTEPEVVDAGKGK
ncbi:MAG: preprotein translocase subunit YajC [bacterium]